MSIYIHKTKMTNGVIKIRIVKKLGREIIGTQHIGYAHNEEERKALLILAREKMRDKRQGELKLFESEDKLEERMEQIKSYSKYLYETIAGIYKGLKFEGIRDEVFEQLTVARIIEPSSKLATIKILEGLGLKAPTNSGIHRSLRRAIKEDYRGEITKSCCKYAGVKRAALLLYDVTTLYFEIDREDEYRKRGYSKERRLEPQIIVGLLVDRKGFPLGIHSFEGNKAETKTIIPVLKEFKQKNKLGKITVVADAGMMSAQNLELIEGEGFNYIVGSRISKTPYEIEEYRNSKGKQLKDGQIFDEKQEFKKEGGEEKIKRRVVYQFRQNRADLDNRNIDKQIKKSESQLKDNAQIKKAKFLKIVKSKKEINYEAIENARLKVGIKGYVTNLSCDGQQVIDAYHNLFQVEKSFRMAKSDLEARPIYHQVRNKIEAHLTVCFAALAISRYIQDRTKISIKKFIERLEPLRTGTIQIGKNIYTVPPKIDLETRKLVELLK